MGCDLVVVDVLRHAVQGGAGEHLRPAGGLVEVVERHHLRLRLAVHVDEADGRVLHACRAEAFGDLGGPSSERGDDGSSSFR